MDKTLSLPGTGASKTRKTLTSLAAAAVLGAGLYTLFGPGRLFTGADPGNEELVALGQGVYRDNCASCHGANREGQANWRTRNADGTLKAPPHDDSGHTWHHSDKVLYDYIKKGGVGMAPLGFQSAMPGFGEDLKDREIWAVLAFIKSRWSKEVLVHQRQITTRGG